MNVLQQPQLPHELRATKFGGWYDGAGIGKVGRAWYFVCSCGEIGRGQLLPASAHREFEKHLQRQPRVRA